MVNTNLPGFAEDGRPKLPELAVQAITGRLCGSTPSGAQIPLSLPLSLYQNGQQPDCSAVSEYLRKLLRNPGSFLERYGNLLLAEEWQLFLPLRSDYEVQHYLSKYEEQQACLRDPRHLPASVKNRRLAFMQRLQAGNEYFSDDAMQLRAPLLFQQMNPSSNAGSSGSSVSDQNSEPDVPPAGARGTQLSDWLMRCAQKAEVTRLTKEQQAVEDAQMSEEEEESEAEDEVEQSGDMDETGHLQASNKTAVQGSNKDFLEDQPASPAARSDSAGPAPAEGVGRSCGSSGIPFSVQASSDPAQQAAVAAGRGLHGTSHISVIGVKAMTGGQNSNPHDAAPMQSRSISSVSAALASASTRKQSALRPQSSEEILQQRREFMMEMESRFLTGVDASFVDYRAIDSDTSLDNDWLDQAGRDAEEKYFDDD